MGIEKVNTKAYAFLIFFISFILSGIRILYWPPVTCRLRYHSKILQMTTAAFFFFLNFKCCCTLMGSYRLVDCCKLLFYGGEKKVMIGGGNRWCWVMRARVQLVLSFVLSTCWYIVQCRLCLEWWCWKQIQVTDAR